MRTLVVYDSAYGNTEKIARTIGKAIAGKVLHADWIELSEQAFWLCRAAHSKRPERERSQFNRYA